MLRYIYQILFLTLLTGLVTTSAYAQTAQTTAGQAGGQNGGVRSFTTVTAVRVTPLSNGVQISITSDGILQFRDPDTSGSKMSLLFPDARNGTGKNFINVNRYPVSYIQLTTPQGAANGIGMLMQINNFVATNASVSRTPEGQGVLLTIQSDRTIESSTRGGGNADAENGAGTEAGADNQNPMPTSTQIQFDKGVLSLRAVRVDIHELMGAIAKKTGLAIAIDDAVDRKVSLNLAGVDPATAIRSIATAYGLALSQINGIYMMSEGVPTDLATYHLSGTASYRMQNTQAQTASGLLPNFLYSYVKVNAEQNAVVVTAPSQMLAKIGADLDKMDVPSPQILIEAIAVELTDTTNRDIGLLLGNPDPAQFSSINVAGGSVIYSSVGKLPKVFDVNLHALELRGKARVRARPRLAVVNGRTADIFIGAQRFIQVQFNGYGNTQTRIQPVDVGVKFSITPLTGGNGEITTRIVPEVSNITELDLQTGLPVLSTRRAETYVRVKDGETIAIGGLTLDQEQRTQGKIPVLGDLPLLGGLFHSNKKNVVRTELVVFVTPHIIPTSALVATPDNLPNNAAATTATPPAAKAAG
ncbi:MAG: type II and III secretion system protein [Abitibacteriaceae bacterium]|nr:type II and III secretion system protein [Abditibacteriaceae bacterium]